MLSGSAANNNQPAVLAASPSLKVFNTPPFFLNSIIKLKIPKPSMTLPPMELILTFKVSGFDSSNCLAKFEAVTPSEPISSYI